ncbi:SETMR methyltransferase, partial [Acromyrmex charruanus]
KMEISRENFRAIFYDYKCNLTPKQCIDRLHLAFGDEAPSNRTVYNWFAEFHRGRTFLCDEFREGRPSTSVVATNVVHKMIERDRHMTYREIQTSLGIDVKTIHTILHDHLSVRKLCSRWISHNLTEAQKQARVKWSKEMLKKFNRDRSNLIYNIVTGDETWIYSYKPESKQQSTVWVFQNEPKFVHSATKQMIACFFSYTGHVTLKDRRTVNIHYYTTICLPEVINKLRRTNRNRRIILHHDNVDFLSSKNVELMTHCPYSPDLSPNDFFLFPNIKKKMRGESLEAAVETFRTLISEVTASEKKCFENWFEHMQKYIDLKGEYFKKQ